MKKLIWMCLLNLSILVLISGLAVGQVWHLANQATVAWDESTALVNGDPIPAGDIVRYKIYLSDGVGNRTELEETDNSQATITFTNEGQFFVGVSSLRYDQENNLLSESPITWSNVEPSEPFGFVFWQMLAEPIGLRIQ